MARLVFDDSCLTITCCYEQAEGSPVIPKSLTLDKDIYDEIKEILPGFMGSCGCYHDKVETSGGLELIINWRTRSSHLLESGKFCNFDGGYI